MYKTVPLKYSMFYEKDNPVFGESATHISIDDEAGGGYIVLEQFSDDGTQKLRLNLNELKELLRIANKLMSEYNKVTNAMPESETEHYIIETQYDDYGSPSYRFKGLHNGETRNWFDTEGSNCIACTRNSETGTWFDTLEEAIKQAENRVNLG